MRSIVYKALVFLLVVAFSSFTLVTEEAPFSYQVKRVYPSLSLTKPVLADAQTLADLNYRYPAEWVAEYLNVELSLRIEGAQKQLSSNTFELTEEQQHLLAKADPASIVAVTVDYLPKNNLSHNEAKQIEFEVFVDPLSPATFSGGSTAMEAYFNKLTSNLDKTAFRANHLAVVQFSIDESGLIIDSEIKEPSNNPEVDRQLLDMVCNMPKWAPASYADGSTIAQEFALLVGDQNSCVRNMLNLRELPRED